MDSSGLLDCVQSSVLTSGEAKGIHIDLVVECGWVFVVGCDVKIDRLVDPSGESRGLCLSFCVLLLVS